MEPASLLTLEDLNDLMMMSLKSNQMYQVQFYQIIRMMILSKIKFTTHSVVLLTGWHLKLSKEKLKLDLQTSGVLVVQLLKC